MKSEEKKKKALKQHLGKHTNKEKQKQKKNNGDKEIKIQATAKKKEKHGFFFFSICRAAPKKIWKLCKEWLM